MKKIKNTLLLGLCTALCTTAIATFAAEDFSFDLDAALNEAEGVTGTKTEGQTPASNGSAGKAIYQSVDAQSYLNASNNMYYDPALIESLITKYKEKNYVGCIQEAQSKMKQENPNPVAMYYMALSYTQIGDVKAALELYDSILKLQPSETLTECAIRGRDCLIGGSACPNKGIEGADIDAHVQEYKNSTKLNYNPNDNSYTISQILTEQEMKTLPDMLVNSNQSAEKKTLDLEKKVENSAISPEIQTTNNEIANNDEIAQALKTLQNAGIAVTIQPAPMQNIQNFNPEMAQMSMLLGYNQSQNKSFDMLPYMMMQNQNNSNNQYNSQMLQAMMMNYMMPSLDFGTKDKD